MNLPALRGRVSYFQFHPHPFDFAQDRPYPLPSREREYYISPMPQAYFNRGFETSPAVIIPM